MQATSRVDSYNTNRQWADAHLHQIKKILFDNIKHFVNISIASKELDTKYGTDLVLTMDSDGIGVRTRRDKTSFRDLTIRSYTSGRPTELDKIKRGVYPRWYFYTWCDNNDNIEDWMIIDMRILVNTGVFLSNLREYNNTDGTRLVGVGLEFIRQSGALVACSFSSKISGFKNIKSCD